MLQEKNTLYTAKETRIFARQLGLKPFFTPIRSPPSSGLAEPSFWSARSGGARSGPNEITRLDPKRVSQTTKDLDRRRHVRALNCADISSAQARQICQIFLRQAGSLA